MAVRKIAISVPENILKQVDRLARRSKKTRSGFITQVLQQVSSASTQAEITEKINHLFTESEILAEQTNTAGIYLRAAEKDEDFKW